MILSIIAIVIFSGFALTNFKLSNGIKKDKLGHFLILLFFTLVIMFFDPYVAIASGSSLSIGKELYDYIRKGKFSLMDLAADLAGMLLALWVYILIIQ